MRGKAIHALRHQWPAVKTRPPLFALDGGTPLADPARRPATPDDLSDVFLVDDRHMTSQYLSRAGECKSPPPPAAPHLGIAGVSGRSRRPDRRAHFPTL